MQRFLFKYFSNTSPMSSNSCRQIAEIWAKGVGKVRDGKSSITKILQENYAKMKHFSWSMTCYVKLTPNEPSTSTALKTKPLVRVKINHVYGRYYRGGLVNTMGQRTEQVEVYYTHTLTFTFNINVSMPRHHMCGWYDARGHCQLIKPLLVKHSEDEEECRSEGNLEKKGWGWGWRMLRDCLQINV